MPKNKHIHWTYNTDRPRREYLDPRLPVARHIGWNKVLGAETVNCVPEPDNYNRAVITDKPVECLGIEDQVIYLDRNKQHWVTVLYVPEEQFAEYDLWLARLKPTAHWQHSKPPKIRKQRSLML